MVEGRGMCATPATTSGGTRVGPEWSSRRLGRRGCAAPRRCVGREPFTHARIGQVWRRPTCPGPFVPPGPRAPRVERPRAGPSGRAGDKARRRSPSPCEYQDLSRVARHQVRTHTHTTCRMGVRYRRYLHSLASQTPAFFTQGHSTGGARPWAIRHKHQWKEVVRKNRKAVS